MRCLGFISLTYALTVIACGPSNPTDIHITVDKPVQSETLYSFDGPQAMNVHLVRESETKVAGFSPPRIIKATPPQPEIPIHFNRRPADLIDITISETGKVLEVVLVSKFHPIADEAVVRAVREWVYEPARQNGKPVAYKMRITITYAE